VDSWLGNSIVVLLLCFPPLMWVLSRYLLPYTNDVPPIAVADLRLCKSRLPAAMALLEILFVVGWVVGATSLLALLVTTLIWFEALLFTLWWAGWHVIIYAAQDHLPWIKTSPHRLTEAVKQWREPRWRRVLLWLLLIFPILFLPVIIILIYISTGSGPVV